MGKRIKLFIKKYILKKRLIKVLALLDIDNTRY